MIDKNIIRRSNEMWIWGVKNPNHVYHGFHEIYKFEDLIKSYGYRYVRTIEDGGLTIIVYHDDGKKLAKVKENCYSEGGVVDLLEVCGIYGEKPSVFHGFKSAHDAFSIYMNCYRKYSKK